MKLSILVAVIIIRYMVTECHLIPRSERLWIKQTIPIAQDKFKNILIKKPHMQGKHSSFEEDRYFHDKQDLEMIKPVIENEATSKKSFSERHRFLATHVWKVQHRWPLVYRAKRSSQAVPVKSYERNEILVESESGKFSQQKGESFEEFLLHQVSNNSQGNNTETLNNIISNTTDVEKPEHCNTDCVETKLQFDESGNFNCGANCTSAEDMTTYDLEMSDQPHGGQGVGSDCTTDCGVIKEAETLCHTCHQVCHYVPGSRRVKCGCYHGYAIGPDWLHCIDIDECSVNNSWLCHGGTCMNTVGSFMCRCRPGYQLVGHMCMDVDECTQNKGTVGMCDQVCINVPGAYQCWCHKGFTLSSINPRSCVDINECESSVCSHNCSNTVGSFICTCPPNMKLHHDGRTCVLRSEGEGTRVGIDNNSKNIIIDGSRKIVIYGQNTSEQLSPVYGSAPLPTQIVQSSVPLRSAIQQKYGTNTEWHSANSKNQSRARDFEGTKSKSKGLMNTLPSYTSPLEVLTVARGISAVDSRDIRYKPCIPSCKNGGFCDGKRKCHCRQGFQGRYCQIDVNECSRVPSLCNYVCVNTFGSYQCLCPSGYTISGDRKSCIIHTSPVVETASINNRNKYNAVIEVLVSPNRMTADHGAHKITPTLIESSFTSEIGSLRTRLHNPAYPPNKLAIENLHTMAYSGPNLLSQVDSLFSSEQIPNEVQPTYVLYKDEETYPSSYMEPTAFLSTKVEDIVKSSEYIFGSPFTTSVTQLNSTPTLKDELGMETVPNLIVRSDVPESSISVFQQIVITPTHTGMLVTPFSTVPANITMDHSQEDLSGEKDPSKDAKKDNKGKGKKTKKLSHKDEKQKPRKDKDKKMRNKTLKKGRIKFVRLTTDFQVLNQILDASREAWRDGGTRLPVGKPRAETNWNMGTLAGGNTASGLGDRYFEVIDYDDDYFDEPLRKTYNNSDPFAVPVTVPSILSTDLTVLPRHWNLTGKPEQDCYHGDKKIKSRTTLYRDEKNCTKCICKDGELRCKPHHCPTPHCEAPLHGRCCDYCPDDCLVSDDVYHPGERFVPAVDVCRECRCVAGRAVCENIHCPALDCPEQFQVIVPEECCPVCTPPEPGCFYKGRFFYQGQLWVRKEGRCQACLCKDGAVQCNPVVCVVNCQHPQFVPGECCPLCDGCQHYNRKYNDQEMFPHPSDPCSICQCQHGNITCYPKPCNIACSHPYRPSGDCCPTCRHCYFSDRKISNGASLVINNGTCQECTCKQGNVTCKPAACAAPCMIRGKPIPSGAEFHIGSDTCTQCRCWNGTVSCHAVECETTCSHGVLLPHRCCLDCTKCDYEGQLYSEMQVFRPSGDTCKSCLCVKGIVMCQETCSSTPPKH